VIGFAHVLQSLVRGREHGQRLHDQASDPAQQDGALDSQRARARDRIMRGQNTPELRGQRRGHRPLELAVDHLDLPLQSRDPLRGQGGGVQLFAGRLQQRPDSQQPVWLLDPGRRTAIGGFADYDDEPQRWRDSPVFPGLPARDLHGFHAIRLAIAPACHQRRSSQNRQREVPGRAGSCDH